ncbi:PPIE isoform 5 [Pongo abelii]|uniref:PPIE isoform 5 n=3 Tax=Pongo abelii TaxID=9601 RepID=A0A2J8Y6B2_PONAB|nr:PPIE isoform 5 [Pongo abelii]
MATTKRVLWTGRGGGRQSSSCCIYSFWRHHRYSDSSGL